jgi:hypothetical protein
MTTATAVAVILAAGAVGAGVSLLVRRLFPRLGGIDPSAWSATLGYVATAYGVVLGFSIVFLFGEFADARSAVGDEATAIGTAFEEARLFPTSATDIQHSLICYAEAVRTYEWPALEHKRSAPEVDGAYRDVILALGDVTEPAEKTFQPAAATNIFVQVGNISTARETRLVAASIEVPALMWILLVLGGSFVLGLIFVVTLRAGPAAQATLVGLSAMFTAVMFLIVVALSMPFSHGGGRVRPTLIEDTAAAMIAAAPEAATLACAIDGG